MFALEKALLTNFFYVIINVLYQNILSVYRILYRILLKIQIETEKNTIEKLKAIKITIGM